MSVFDLEDKVAIVTGGGSGIGEAISKAFATAGAHVVVGARRQERLDRVAGEIREMGKESLAIATDVTVPEQVDNLVQKTLAKFGRLDIMVANSGGWRFSTDHRGNAG